MTHVHLATFRREVKQPKKALKLKERKNSTARARGHLAHAFIVMLLFASIWCRV